MKKKELTPTIAKALAEQTMPVILQGIEKKIQDIKEDVLKTSAFKKLVKMEKELKDLEDNIQTCKNAISLNFSTSQLAVRFGRWNNNQSSKSIEVYPIEGQPEINIDYVKNMILAEDYLSTGTETMDELVKRISTAIMKRF